ATNPRHAAQAFRHLPGERDFTQTDVVSLVYVVQDARKLGGGVGLEGPLTIGPKVLEVFVRTTLTDSVGAVAVTEPRTTLHRNQSVQRERAISNLVRPRGVPFRQARSKVHDRVATRRGRT